MHFSNSYNSNTTEITEKNFVHLTELKQFVKSLDSKIKVNKNTTSLSMDLTTTSESTLSSDGFAIPNNNPQQLYLSSRDADNDQSEILFLRLNETNRNQRKSYFKKRSQRTRKPKTKFVTEDSMLYEF
ncbi:hypothetical protein M0813_01787 [Anaeramoeba flamelloides]|uniref:Uncharacterized protein n=1 Tax=Anaeramoeba flamelloides TaxID=1746091 RepID=A0AAV7YQA4_9EUKA|nr:hypothetical protein M0812_23631 [Anaeramoeba flamelloides]KAJ6249187.1 hypothetical protein M0813_01787 [Anaeramoeba flamelloides]|eukprot:Anaeramoba_flamelloidesa1053752_42.p1 GENE.a1053752_42~~a1053752_42.p1  ORF type:complete len:128 (+),score=26.04 a1053752_42:153-536(+)